MCCPGKELLLVACADGSVAILALAAKGDAARASAKSGAAGDAGLATLELWAMALAPSRTRAPPPGSARRRRYRSSRFRVARI